VVLTALVLASLGLGYLIGREHQRILFNDDLQEIYRRIRAKTGLYTSRTPDGAKNEEE